MMCKLLFLQHLYNLSDESVIAESELNLAYMYFLGINPEDSFPDKSLLSKFRTQRLQESTLDKIITEIVRQCVKKGIIKDTSVSIDATDERIITSVKTADGAYVDGTYAKEMLDNTKKAGIKIDEVYGDKAYFRKPILDDIKAINAKAYIPVSATVYKVDESKFSYNKDSDEWQCSQGNITVKKKYYKTQNKSGIREGYKYYFELSQCKSCPKHDECAKKSSRKTLWVGLNTNKFYEISQYQKTDEFKEKYKKRASIEGKNAELKRFHGLYRARGYGLLSVSKQSKLAAIAVNIKRIAAIVSSLLTEFNEKFLIIRLNFNFLIVF